MSRPSLNIRAFLAYPRESFEIKTQFLEIVGRHPRIIASKRLTEHGRILQHAPNGNLHDHITPEPDIQLDRRLR